MDTQFMNSIYDNLEDIYICENDNNDNNNIETLEKYVQDGNFIFGDITENIIGPLDKTSSRIKLSFDSECTDVGMTVSIIDDEYINVEYAQKEMIEKINKNLITDFIDNVNIKKDDYKDIPSDLFNKNSEILYTYQGLCLNENILYTQKLIINEEFKCPTDITHMIDKDSIKIIGIDIDTKENITENNKDVIIDIDKLSDSSLTPSNSFFDCYNEENSVNNVIACNTIHSIQNSHINEMATSYMFDNEDLRTNDIYPFHYNSHSTKQKGWFESVGIAAASAMVILKNIVEDD